jgi:hypothetical protein
MSERIGIVMVHGVGEQKRFQHLSNETKQIILSLRANKDISKITVQTQSTQDAELGAEHQSWLAENGAPIQIDFVDRGTNKTLFIHEVWWADLDNKASLWEKMKFWGWAFGQWGFVHYTKSKLPGFHHLQVPSFNSGNEQQRNFMARLRLWSVGIVFLMTMLSLIPLGYMLRRLGIKKVGSDIFYQYLGDVKLYQDFKQAEQGYLTDIGHPPRVPIRRRMIRVLIDAYLADYDRWYVLAHSLGSVLAWNGLMETAHCLPNYLDEKTWKKCTAQANLVINKPGQGPINIMRPDRPLWIQNNDAIIDRSVLFAKLRGLVTYGSPLDKFAYLWGAIVPINPDATAFNHQFEWINIFDHVDPVAAALTAYSNAPCPPKNYAYNTSSLFLISHIKYLSFKNNMPDCFVNRLNQWILSNSTFAQPAAQDLCWDQNTSFAKGLKLRLIWWTAITVLLALFLGWVLTYLLGGSIALNSIYVLFVSILIVTIAGKLRHGIEHRLNKSLYP